MARHYRFWVAFALGLGATALSILQPMELAMHALVGADVFFLTYLILMLHLAQTASPEVLRKTVEQDDEGLPFILALAGGVIGISLTSILLVLNNAALPGPVAKGLAFGSVPLGWATLHSLLAFHYAHLFYRPVAADTKGGLRFPGTKTPGPWDFLYFSFGVGTTAQVSDVIATSMAMRKMITGHAVASFFYNTVILALAVNAAVSAGR